MLTGLNHLTLAVSDLDRSFDFYRHLLGFTPHARWQGGAYLSLGALWLCLSLDEARTQPRARDYTHYAFSVAPEHIERVSERLRKGEVRSVRRVRMSKAMGFCAPVQMRS